MKSPSRVAIRLEWWQLINTVRAGDRERMAFALLQRLFIGTAPLLPERLQALFTAIEREIIISERQRSNVACRWSGSKTGIVPSTAPSTVPSTAPSTAPGSRDQGAHAETHDPGARVPAQQNTGRARSIKKSRKKVNNKLFTKEKPLLNPAAPAPLTGTHCCDLPEAYRKKWDEWEKYLRLRNGRAIVPITAAKQIQTLLQYTAEEADRIIDYSIANGYQGIFPDKVIKKSENKDYSGI